MRKLLFAICGARTEILEQCPTERVKFESLGCAILITSGMATISMWFALSSAMGVNAFLALPGALLWGMIIMGIDRWLVTSMPIDGKRRLGIAIPRLLLALLLGSLISTPIVLRIFQPEINAQITLIKQQRASAFLAEQQNSQVGAQVAYWRSDVTNLQNVIDSGGEVPINPSTDPQVQSLTKQRDAELNLEQQYYKQWQCQLYGGQGCPKGNGPLAQASEASYHQAAAQVASLNNQIQQRENQLSATDAASKQARLQQANSALPAAKEHLNTALARQDALQESFDAQNDSLNGLLIRLQALNQLSDKNFTVNATRLLLFLLFLVIECLPVTVKLLQQPGNYEKILQTARERELADARRSYRNMPKMASARVPEHDLDTELRVIWRAERGTPSHEMPTPSYERPTVTSSSQYDPVYPELEETGEHGRLDDTALREMDDTRTPTEFDRRGGGISLHYKHDDL